MFANIANVVLLVISGALAIPCLVLLAECLFSLRREPNRPSAGLLPRPQVCVVIPAHDEENVIERTIHALHRQTQMGDMLLVVADNCADRTAAVARAAGAEVIERKEPERQGKGFALAFAVQHLSANPPEIVLFLDADCELSGDAIATLARLACSTDRPIQAAYLMQLPSKYRPRDVVSCLAFTVKNLVRPRGLARLGLPCHLTGTGIACAWHLVGQVNLETDDIVEDIGLGLQWAVAGSPPMFCEQVRVTSVFPQREDAARSQRTRWEHGHIHTILSRVPHVILQGVRQRRPDLIALGLDLAVPPLSLLVMFVLLGMTAGISASLLGAPAAAAWSFGAELLVIAISVLLGWWQSGRDRLPFRIFLAVPQYLLWKVPVYLAFLGRRQKQWLRTPRDS